MKANELKVTDLMVGDWVMSFGAPHKIVGVRTDMLEPHIMTDMSDTWYEEGIENLLEPIPITKELLEKNGFELKSESPYYQCFAIDFDDVDIDYLVVALHPKANYVKVDYQTEKRKVHLSCSLGGCHLHELQHLLRICKIDKEIVV